MCQQSINCLRLSKGECIGCSKWGSWFHREVVWPLVCRQHVGITHCLLVLNSPTSLTNAWRWCLLKYFDWWFDFVVNYLVRRSASLVKSMLKWPAFYGSYQKFPHKGAAELPSWGSYMAVGRHREKSHGMKWSHHRWCFRWGLSTVQTLTAVVWAKNLPHNLGSWIATAKWRHPGSWWFLLGNVILKNWLLESVHRDLLCLSCSAEMVLTLFNRINDCNDLTIPTLLVKYYLENK